MKDRGSGFKSHLCHLLMGPWTDYSNSRCFSSSFTWGKASQHHRVGGGDEEGTVSGGHTHGVHVRKPHALLLSELSGAVSKPVTGKCPRSRPAVSEARPEPEDLAAAGQKQASESMALWLT